MSSEEKLRALKQAEIDLAWQVFRNTLPYKRILIGNKLGWFDCPWMEIVDAPGWGTGDFYYLHMGPIGYPDATASALMTHDNDEVRNAFIHELTHVWQAYHDKKWVFTRSVANQICAMADGSYDAYSYELGRDWNKYNVEQQAKLVEDWFKVDKMATGYTFRYQYIRDHIRNR